MAGALSAGIVLLLAARFQPRARPRRNASTDARMAARRRRPRLGALPIHFRSSGRERRGGPVAVAQWCDDLARAIRNGASLSGALTSCTPPTGCVDAIRQVEMALTRGAPLRHALDQGEPTSPDLDVAFVVLRACAEAGGPPAEPIDRAAAALRARSADAAERATYSAQARMSAAVMTVLPLALAAVLLATSRSVREVVVSPSGAAIVLVGALMNLAGWWWMRRIIAGPRRPARTLLRRTTPSTESLPDVIDLVVLGVRAGLAPSAALSLGGRHASPDLRPAFDEVDHRLRRAQRLGDALQALPELLGAPAASLADGFAAADRYGLPLEPLLDRLSIEVRTDRRRHAERHARTLPVRLAFPLVCCTLPSFVLLAIAPAVLGAVTTLRGTAP